LLAIGTNKKSVQEIRAGNRGRVAKHRAKKAEASPNSVTVTENPEPVRPSVPTENGAVQATSKIDADNAEASTKKGKTECAKREAGRKPQAQKALDQFKYAVNHWLPQMDDDTKREAVEYAVAKSGVTVSCASDK
jgi:hypothetical protein